MVSFSTTSWKWPDIHNRLWIQLSWLSCVLYWVSSRSQFASFLGLLCHHSFKGMLLNLAILQVCKPLSGPVLQCVSHLVVPLRFFLGYHSLWQSLYNSSLSLTFQYVTNPPSANERTFTGLADYIHIPTLVLPFGNSELTRLLLGANSSTESQYFLVLSLT